MIFQSFELKENNQSRKLTLIPYKISAILTILQEVHSEYKKEPTKWLTQISNLQTDPEGSEKC